MTLLDDAEQHLLHQIFIGAVQGSEMSELDGAVLSDDVLATEIDKGKGDVVLAMLDRLLAVAADDLALSRALGGSDALVAPEGRSARGWLIAMHQRTRELMHDRSLVPDYPYENRTGFEPPRASRWTFGDPTLEALTTITDDLETWMAEPHDDTWYREHFVVDLGRSIGSVAPVVSHDLGNEVLWDRATPTTIVSIGVERLVRRPRWDSGRTDEVDTRNWSVAYSRAELPLDPAVRQRFPDLVHLFGGYLGQPFDDEHGWPQWKIAELMRRTRGSARDRMRAQLAELLTIESDDELTATVGHLGSYCLPYFMRHWIDRLHWKIDALDWGPPVVPRDD